MSDREDIKLDLLEWTETDEALQTKWRFSAVLTLPWRPRLAASGGTTHVFSKVSKPSNSTAGSAFDVRKGLDPARKGMMGSLREALGWGR